ncbi:MAG: Validoxylamine A 7'-phosphate phosphatase [Chroococcopsis gigantea SAG 12.99]|jgi:beta-phosphoglucomutase|nr:HAD family phosphatase [Chlorogloea purpurea SAG 13.99]MDV3000404.1 Validoxylamine A 7'-phosphate phosphatase [Chroococcopsis gigantea SAG 12.99]
MVLKVFLFDFNGVIINDERIHKLLIDELILGENLRATAKDFIEVCLGRSDRAGLRDLLARKGRIVTEEYLTKLIIKKAKMYEEKIKGLSSLPVYPDLGEFLETLRQKEIPMGIVTGALRSEVDLILDKANIGQYFSVIVAGDDINTSKPQPDGYLLAVERFNRWNFNLQLQPSECMAIEDTPAGITAAKSAGIPVVGIAHTYPFHFMQRLSNWAVDNFNQLDLSYVEQVFSQK